MLSLWRKKSWPIFHVKHRSKQRESVFWPEQEGFEFKDEFHPLEGERIIEKSVPCAFVNNSLDNELKSFGVNEIALVGVATNNSVESTARTGGNLGYTVYVVENACFTFAKPDYFGAARSADEVHAMFLANLHGEYATVLSCAQLIEVSYEELWFSRNGDNLQITQAGTDNQVTVNSWYNGVDHQLDIIQTDTSALLNNQVDQLVSAMASYDVPLGAGNVVSQDVKDQLQTVLADTWQVA